MEVDGRPLPGVPARPARGARSHRGSLLVGWLGEEIERELGDSYGSISLRYSWEDGDDRLGTAGAVKNASRYADEPFFLLNGDVLTDMDLSSMMALHRQKGASATIATVNLPSPYGVLECEDSLVREFREKPELPYRINAGIYVLDPEVVEEAPKKGSLERDVFPEFAAREQVHCFHAPNAAWKDIGTHKDLDRTEEMIPELEV